MFEQIKNHVVVQRARRDFSEFLSSIKNNVNRDLFEASSDFWAYHLGGLSALVAMDMILSLLLRPSFIWDYQFFSLAVWVSGFSLATLIFRSHYKRAHWDTQPQVPVLIKCVGCAVFFSVPITLLLVTINIIFLDDVQRFFQLHNPSASGFEVLIEFSVRNLFITSFHLLCWMTLYISVTSRRQTKEIEIANLRLQNSLREAELSSLSNQLNPHFLFNALNNIRFMIQEDANNAEVMLMSLSHVLRYSLDSSKQSKVTFEREVEISQKYIDLVQIQFEERLTFSMDVPTEFMQCTVPPMALQMLLENAVKHGIENIAEGGEISVSAKFKNNVLSLTVCNDLSANHQHKNSESGIGLLNIEQRLDLLYGNLASLETNTLNGRHCAILNIPQQPLDDDSEPPQGTQKTNENPLKEK